MLIDLSEILSLEGKTQVVEAPVFHGIPFKADWDHSRWLRKNL